MGKKKAGKNYSYLKIILPLIAIFFTIFIASLFYLSKPVSFAPNCGNGIIDNGEVCDIGLDAISKTADDVVGEENCNSQNFDNGRVYCKSGCVEFEISQCYDEKDTDGDGLLDSWEITKFGNIQAYSSTDDPDADEVINKIEMQFVLNPQSSDTDGDGLTDYDELFMHQTYADFSDSDYDEISDHDEIINTKTNPRNSDSDGDGMEDGEEINSGRNPLMKEALSFQFTYNDGGIRERKVEGLKATDSLGHEIKVFPWLELTQPNSKPAERSITYLEITENGIDSWAQAGASHIGVVGIAFDDRSGGWMNDDSQQPGYQNTLISELNQRADNAGIKLIMGVKMSSMIHGYEDDSWKIFFDNPEKFDELRKLINDVTSYTGTNEFIIEMESPLNSGGNSVMQAYRDGEIQLTTEEVGRLKSNLAKLKINGVKISFWVPDVGVNCVNPQTLQPERSLPNCDDLYYVNAVFFRALHESLGENFVPIGRGAWYDVVSKRRVPPYDQFATTNLEYRQKIGAHNYGEMMFLSRPFSIDNIPKSNPRSRIERGPSELVRELSYVFGRKVDNSKFLDIPLDTLYIYPGITNFDIVGEGVASYLQNGIDLSVVQRYNINEGDLFNFVIDSTNKKSQSSNFEITYDGEYGISPDADKPKIIIENDKAFFQWIPGPHRGGKDFNYYEIKFKTNGEETISPIKITVYNNKLDSLNYEFSDGDGDGYSNKDEIDNENDPDNLFNFPINDFDLDFISDLNDIDDDNDGYLDGGDCSPENPEVHPGATEICDDNIDNDCNGKKDGEEVSCGAEPPPKNDNNNNNNDGNNNNNGGGNNPLVKFQCDDNLDNDNDGKTDYPQDTGCSGPSDNSELNPRLPCEENWECSDWTECSGGNQTRTCNDSNSCGTETNKPIEVQECQETQSTDPLRRKLVTLIAFLTGAVTLTLIIIALILWKRGGPRVPSFKEKNDVSQPQFYKINN